jgi:hypothetical protein
MKGVFGMLLIGGGVILMYGMFTGKITFPFAAATPATPGGAQPAATNTIGHFGKVLV